MRFLRAAALVLVVVLLTVTAALAQDVTLSVAVSLKDAVEALGRQFTTTRPGVTLRYNFGASGDLQKQIEAGAPIDLFLSAATRQMDELEKQKLIVVASRKVFARNVLVVVKPTDSKVDIEKASDLLAPRVTRVVIGQPKTVPAGQYAEESLRAMGLWDRLQPKLVFSENVRQALDYVARGEVDAGFVYTTDAATRAQGVKEAFRPPEDTYRPVIYPGAVVATSKQPALAQAFLDLLGSVPGRAVLAKYGFQPPAPTSCLGAPGAPGSHGRDDPVFADHETFGADRAIGGLSCRYEDGGSNGNEGPVAWQQRDNGRIGRHRDTCLTVLLLEGEDRARWPGLPGSPPWHSSWCWPRPDPRDSARRWRRAPPAKMTTGEARSGHRDHAPIVAHLDDDGPAVARPDGDHTLVDLLDDAPYPHGRKRERLRDDPRRSEGEPEHGDQGNGDPAPRRAHQGRRAM